MKILLSSCDFQTFLFDPDMKTSSSMMFITENQSKNVQLSFYNKITDKRQFVPSDNSSQFQKAAIRPILKTTIRPILKRLQFVQFVKSDNWSQIA